MQNCPEEVSHNGITVQWSQSATAINIESDPKCFINDEPVKRNCTDDAWTPSVDDVGPCLKAVKSFNATSCPPGFNKISKKNNEYCYQVSSNSTWGYPCFSSGGTSVVTDLNEEEINSLIESLVKVNVSRYYWLPAHRPKLFNPVVWSIPGPNWGVQVNANDHITYHNLIWKNCLALDIEQRTLTTDACTQNYPNLCFYINNAHYPAVCPKGYHTFRYKPDNGTCYGIETSETGLTFQSFLNTKCNTPMTDNQHALSRFIFTKIAELNELPDDQWCWFKTDAVGLEKNNPYTFKKGFTDTFIGFEGVIDNVGTLSLVNSSSTLFCMACEADVIYGETELVFEFNEAENQIYLTVYFPSGLWKYDNDDKGIQCFSDAKGFVNVVGINDLPVLSVKTETDGETTYIEKIVYVINLISQQSAQYWCEGHTFNFSLISTSKIVVNPKGKETHVFALTINFYNKTYEIGDTSRIDLLLYNLTEMFSAQKIIWMDVYELTPDNITVLLHVHTTISDQYEEESMNIQETLNKIKEIAIVNLPNINCSFVNVTSSIYCLPTTSCDIITLNWGLTSIGHMCAPNEFCLQSNGLPVKRQCLGSYLNGAFWGNVEGRCDSNYRPTETTTFLYNIGKGQAPSNYTSSFLTEGLEFVLSDIGTIIPADIFYLSMSLQQIIHIAEENQTSVEMGDIDNMAWVTDRVMEFDWDYLRLAQTLNSTNVILNSISDIIEIIAKPPLNKTSLVSNETKTTAHELVYKLAVKPQFVVQISYPTFTNITGIAISRTSDNELFTDMIVKPLYANSSLSDVLEINNLEIAAWLPSKLIKTLKPNANSSVNHREKLHIIISVFQNDAIFQELLLKNHIVNSRIIGVSVPGFLSNFEYPLPIVFRDLSKSKNKKHCGFWDFEMQKLTMTSGLWKTHGCYPVNSRENITICKCYHLTHFSQLITIPTGDPTEHPNAIQHTRALNIITLVGCFLSLVGIVGIWITALVFANWRKKAGTKVLLQLSTAIALPLVFIVIFNLDKTIFAHDNGKYVIATHMKPLCIVLGSLLHYSILSSFMWMLITAILQFIRYVRVLGVSRPSRFMIKFSLIGWGIPMIPVIIVLSIDIDNYIPESSSYKKLCYPKELYFVFAVLLPICIILFTNVILFLLVLHSISRSSDKTKSTDFDLVGAQMRVSVFLFFLLGLTWIFGIFSFSANLIWSYLFCLSSTLQGFVLFIYFIICDPTTRNMWVTLVKPPFSSSSSRDSITSLS